MNSDIFGSPHSNCRHARNQKVALALCEKVCAGMNHSIALCAQKLTLNCDVPTISFVFPSSILLPRAFDHQQSETITNMASFFAKARERAEAAAQQLQAHHAASSANKTSDAAGSTDATSSSSNFSYTGAVPHLFRQGSRRSILATNPLVNSTFSAKLSRLSTSTMKQPVEKPRSRQGYFHMGSASLARKARRQRWR